MRISAMPMVASMDLTPPQAARVLEQALRLQAHIELEVRPVGLQGRTLSGRIVGRENNLLRVRPAPGVDVNEPLLIGACCDALLVLNAERYEFSTCIIDLGAAQAPELLLAMPPGIQVANRRRYVRRVPRDPWTVQLWVRGGDMSTTCAITDLAPTGIAARGHRGDLDDVLFVGDTIRVTIDTPDGNSYDLPAVICTKTLERDKQSMTVGLEFPPNASPEDLITLSRYRAALNDPATGLTEMDGAQ
jgi:hypothetical protein